MIIIVGAGISGLAAAFELTERRMPFRILEASPRPGGLIQTERCGGFTIDAGADSMLATKPAARALCGEVGLAAELQTMRQPRTAYVAAWNRLFALPAPSVLGLPITAGAAARFDLLPFHARLRLLFERFVPPGPPADESIASFFRRRFGAATVALVAQPLLGGIHAGDVEHLSARSLVPHLVEAEETAGSVLRGLTRRVSPPEGMFISLAGGMGTLPEALVKALPAGSIRYRSEVRSVSAESGRWRVDADDGSEYAMAVVFAAPVNATGRLLGGIDSQAATLCAQVPHASTVSVALAWPRDAIAHPLSGSGFVVARDTGELRVTACTWVSSKWEGRAPSGYALLRAFIGGVADPAAVDLPDEDLIAIAVRDLQRVLGVNGPPELTRVYRWRDASPQLNVGHEARVRRIAGQIERHAGLFITGRGFRAVGIPDCISDARSAAAAAADYVSSRSVFSQKFRRTGDSF